MGFHETSQAEHKTKGWKAALASRKTPDHLRPHLERKIAEHEKPEGDTKYKYGSTQANIPDGSDAAKALRLARLRVSSEDFAGKGATVGGNHLTVRYGIKGDDLDGIRKYISSLEPFEAKLGKTAKFPPSESSDGAAVIHAPVEAPELHKINAELAKHGDFIEPTFDYHPHSTVAYVKDEKADKYVGMPITAGKEFTVNSIAITDRSGKQEEIKLEGKGSETLKWEVVGEEELEPTPAFSIVHEQDRPPQRGDEVDLGDGKRGTVVFSRFGVCRVRTEDGQNIRRFDWRAKRR